MTKIRYDKRNYRKHGERNKQLIRKSLSELGAGRSILLDADDSLIAGNGVYEQAEKLGIPVRVIETDGSELIAVKRTDVHEDDEKRRLLAIADNTTSDTATMDVPALLEDLDPITLGDWGVDLPEDPTSVQDPGEGYGTSFSLPDGEKAPFQTMSFQLADQQAEEIKAALEEAKQMEDFQAMEVFGNNNSNGNALAYIVAQWIELRK